MTMKVRVTNENPMGKIRVTTRIVETGNPDAPTVVVRETEDTVHAASSKEFWVHTGQDLLIEEVQP